MKDPLDILTEWAVWGSLEEKKDLELTLYIKLQSKTLTNRSVFKVFLRCR